MTPTLGQKIKNFRKRSGLSQLELEYMIEAAPGSISRIENDIVNPTKETLSAIARSLELRSNEVATLLDINVFSTEELVRAIISFSKSLNLQTTLQTAVDIMFDLFPNYNGGVIFLIDQDDPDKIYSQTVSNMPGMEKVFEIMPKRVPELNVSLTKHTDNFTVRSITDNKPYQSFQLIDFIRHSMPDQFAIIITKILNFQSGIVIPLAYESSIIGSVLYTKRVKEPYSEEEVTILTLLADQIAIAIKNSEKFQSLFGNSD